MQASDANDCPRNFTVDQIIEGLKSGRTFCVDRNDAPELQDLLALQEQGLVTQTIKRIDEQSSVAKFRWVKSSPHNHTK